LISNVFQAVQQIDFGRTGLSTAKKERKGRISFENGIALALSTFQEVRSSRNPKALILIESTYVKQELNFCNPEATDTRSSLTTAYRELEDCLRSLKIVANPAAYRQADKTHSTDPKKRVQGCPKDAFYQSCVSHITRLQNFSRTPGQTLIEKALYKQRIANMRTAQAAYLELQKKALKK
jgi:hypothetical protein